VSVSRVNKKPKLTWVLHHAEAYFFCLMLCLIARSSRLASDFVRNCNPVSGRACSGLPSRPSPTQPSPARPWPRAPGAPPPPARPQYSSLRSYIVSTDQHKSFVRTLSSLMCTRENFPVGHPSQIAPSLARLTWRFFRDRLPKKKMHLVGMITLLILLSLGPRHPIPGARISQSTPP
jgi:hypothetical protein